MSSQVERCQSHYLAIAEVFACRDGMTIPVHAAQQEKLYALGRIAVRLDEAIAACEVARARLHKDAQTASIDKLREHMLELERASARVDVIALDLCDALRLQHETEARAYRAIAPLDCGPQ